MCACGCLLLLVVAGGIAWAILHGLWFAAVLILAVTLAVGWFGRKTFQRPKPPSAGPS
jgi:membrane protein implicated in regulation of membrane protease activity